MNPQELIIWSCAIVFVITAILTLLHITGVWRLHDPKHGEILFKALIVEVVVISLSFFSGFIPSTTTSDVDAVLAQEESVESEHPIKDGTPQLEEIVSEPLVKDSIIEKTFSVNSQRHWQPVGIQINENDIVEIKFLGGCWTGNVDQPKTDPCHGPDGPHIDVYPS